MENKRVNDFQKIKLNEHCMGFAELKDNCWNYSIISIDPGKDILTNEYLAGLIQGRLQGADHICASRNNSWNNTYLCDPSHSFPKEIVPSEEELNKAAKYLSRNYRYLYTWLEKNNENEIVGKIKRLLFRMYGIYCGQAGSDRLSVTFEELKPEVLGEKEFILNYGKASLTFLDIYFINAQLDLFDVISTSLETYYHVNKSDHCSAFLKRTENDIFWTHNSWCGFLAQSHTMTYLIGNGDEKEFVSQNSYCQGQFGSNMDFGFNRHGICFNETTHRYSRSNPTEEGIWLCWRAAAAEMFSRSIEDFRRYVMIDNTSTYLNGYVIIDANTRETALLEMSDRTFAFFHSDGGEYSLKEYITNDNGEQQILEMSIDDYNPDLLSRDYIFGVNYPIDYRVANELESRDNRPKRRIQFRNEIGKVNDLETAKSLITYVEEGEPLSVYGRWDLGYGNAGGYAKIIPDGAVDSKAFSVNAVRELLQDMKFVPNENSANTSFWMLYGTAEIDGKPFIWSESQWKDVQLDHVPDRLQGAWRRIKIFID